MRKFERIISHMASLGVVITTDALFATSNSYILIVTETLKRLGSKFLEW